MKKILVADDDQDIVELLVSRLTANNYEVITAYDGLRAVEQAMAHNPDLIILDIKMPAGTGINVYETLKHSVKTASIPVIFITAYASDDIKNKVMAMGAKDFITKPFASEELLTKICRIIGE